MKSPYGIAFGDIVIVTPGCATIRKRDWREMPKEYLSTESHFTPAEAAPYLQLVTDWHKARMSKDYVAADAIREKLLAAGIWLDSIRMEGDECTGAYFSPFAESPKHREARLSARKAGVA